MTALPSPLFALYCCAVLYTTVIPIVQPKHVPQNQRKVSMTTATEIGPASYQQFITNRGNKSIPTVNHHMRKRQTPSGDYLLIGNQRFIATVDLNGRRASLGAVYNDSAANVIGVDFDYRNNYLFWSDYQQRRIRTSSLNGVGVRTLVSSRLTRPWHIAWDWINSKLYWTDTAQQEIEVYDFINSHRRVIIYTGNTSRPFSIVVDPQNRWLYWTDDSSVNPKIERASMDGTSRSVLHNDNLVDPIGLTIDYSSQTLYWIDARTLGPRIESSSVDGSNRRTVTTLDDILPWGMVFYNGNLYWTDRTNGSRTIYTASTSFPSPRNLLEFTFNHAPHGIQVVSSSRQSQATNPCGASNGGCQYLCLLSAEASEGYTCACPDDLVPDNNGRNCLTPNDGQLRLVQGNYTSSTLTSGRLEIYRNGQWGTVCDDSWGQTEADVACRQLGYTGATGFGQSIDLGYAAGSGRIWLSNVACTSSSSDLLSCSFSSFFFCNHREDVGLRCNTSGLSAGAIAGIAIAIVIVVVVFITVCLVGCCCCYRHRQPKTITSSRPAQPTPAVPQQQEQQQKTGYPPSAPPADYPSQPPPYPGAYPYQQGVGIGGINPYPQQPPTAWSGGAPTYPPTAGPGYPLDAYPPPDPQPYPAHGYVS